MRRLLLLIALAAGTSAVSAATDDAVARGAGPACSGGSDLFKVDDPTGQFSSSSCPGYVAARQNADGSYEIGACNNGGGADSYYGASSAPAAKTGTCPDVAPPRSLSSSPPPPTPDSAYGSGHFGTWETDLWGLPDYRYTADEQTDPLAVQPTLNNSTAAQHQLGNDHIKDFAYNDGYSQFWSQDRLSEWANHLDASNQHYGGGFGWLKVGNDVASTLYPDRAPGAPFTRQFGIGYFHRQTGAGGVRVDQTVYAPFGDDPVVLDDVKLINTTSTRQSASWFEYWDVSPYDQSLGEQSNIGVASPVWSASTRSLSAAQITPRDPTEPLSIFAAAVQGPLDGWNASLSSFFGSGTRSRPAAVASDHLSETVPSPSAPGQTSAAAYAFRSHVDLAPGQSITLRYVYGVAHPAQIPGLVAKYRAASDPLDRSEHRWADWLPRADFGSGYAWVARELEWDAYLLRSATVYEELCGYHTITQGGDYQYSDGYNLGFRSWPHYALPMIYADPELARQIIEYSLALQPPSPAAQFPYGTGPLCERRDIGTSDDLDLWILWAASEYGLATRDTNFFERQLPYYKTSTEATLWQHLKVAFQHQESMRLANGAYLNGGLGDWDDGATEFERMTASTMVTAQLAYVYPRLAELAELKGDRTFAAQLRAAGAADLSAERAQWTSRGWYARGYSGAQQLGSGVIFDEPQPWAILAGAPDASHANTLVANIRRYLDGIGAPKSLGGPERLGTATIPARDDPGITEKGPWPVGPLGPLPDGQDALESTSTTSFGGAAEWPGGVWYDVNGWLTWAYSTLDGVVPGARELAWEEYSRNTLADHATAYPHTWNGTINVDDVCNAFYSQHPDLCGNANSTSFGGSITEQPTWMVMDAVKLAGFTPVKDGFDIAPKLPMARFTLRLPEVGLAQASGSLRGYITTQRSGPVELHVTVPAAARGRTVAAWVGGRGSLHMVAARQNGAVLTFALPMLAERPEGWAVTWS